MFCIFAQRFSNIYKEVLVGLARWVIAATKESLSFNLINFHKNTFNILWSFADFNSLRRPSSRTYTKKTHLHFFFYQICKVSNNLELQIDLMEMLNLFCLIFQDQFWIRRIFFIIFNVTGISI